jgi:hypothetical protein
MWTVRIKSPDIPAQQIELRPGPNRFGRAADNDLQIAHPSISSNHCEIILEKDAVRVRDLGSTNGTSIDGKRVNEARLKSGQNFHLGSVEMILENGVVTEPAKLPVLCVQHPRIQASAECPRCAKFLCDFCVITRRVEGAMKKFCKRCGSECALANLEFTATETDDERAWALLTQALRYPIQEHGWVLLLGGSLLFFIIDVAMAGLRSGTPASAAMALVVGVLAGGYLFAFCQKIITSTSLGEAKMPGWPDFTEIVQDMLHPFRLLWGLFAACFGPALICWYFAHNGSDFAERALHPVTIAGFFYLPMALLGVAMSDSLSSVNPLFVIVSISKVPLQYFISCCVLALILGLKWATENALEHVVPIFFLRYLISAVLLFYFLVVEMRLLGLMYLWNRRKLGWL